MKNNNLNLNLLVSQINKTKKRYNYKDDFEMIYLRHEYISKCKKLNPKYVDEFAGIVRTTVGIMYNKLYPNFNKVGFYFDDIVAITNMYMLSYMELYSIKNNKKLKDRFYKKYIERNGTMPTIKRLNNFDRNSLIGFLRQRLVHLSTVCSRKARNITVGRDRRGAFAFTDSTVEASDEVILKDYKKYGYRKVTKAELKKAKKRAKKDGKDQITDENGYKIIEIELLNNGISHGDYKLLMEENDSLYNTDPEKALMREEEERRIEIFKQKFKDLNREDKVEKIYKFIKNNKGNKYLKKELKLARKIICDPESMVL